MSRGSTVPPGSGEDPRALAAAAPESEPVRLRLYVAGDGRGSTARFAELIAIVAQVASGRARLEIIDVLEDPDRGLRDRVFITPTLVKTWPKPERRLIGDLRDRVALRALLEPGSPDGR